MDVKMMSNNSPFLLLSPVFYFHSNKTKSNIHQGQADVKMRWGGAVKYRSDLELQRQHPLLYSCFFLFFHSIIETCRFFPLCMMSALCLDSSCVTSGLSFCYKTLGDGKELSAMPADGVVWCEHHHFLSVLPSAAFKAC